VRTIRLTASHYLIIGSITVVLQVNASGFALFRLVFAVAFSVLLIVGFAAIPVGAESPIWTIDVQLGGDFGLLQLYTGLSAYTTGLKSTMSISWSSDGFNSSLTIYATGTKSQFENLTQMVVQIQNFAITYGHQTHTAILNYQISIPPNITGTFLEYRLDLRKFAGVIENMLPSGFNASSQQFFIYGQVLISIVWLDAIQETANTEFIRVNLGCDCPGTEANVFVSILEENARLIIEQIGPQNVQMLAPNSFSTEYVIAAGQQTQIYAEWALETPPPFYETQPYDWVISAGVSLVMGAAVSEGYHRIKSKRHS
jgi:hypothetical protein